MGGGARNTSQRRRGARKAPPGRVWCVHLASRRSDNRETRVPHTRRDASPLESVYGGDATVPPRSSIARFLMCSSGALVCTQVNVALQAGREGGGTAAGDIIGLQHEDAVVEASHFTLHRDTIDHICSLPGRRSTPSARKHSRPPRCRRFMDTRPGFGFCPISGFRRGSPFFPSSYTKCGACAASSRRRVPSTPASLRVARTPPVAREAHRCKTIHVAIGRRPSAVVPRARGKDYRRMLRGRPRW